MHQNLILNKIKKTSLGIFYLKNLKKYMFFRIIINFICWRIIYLTIIEISFLFLKNKDLNTLNSSFKHKIIYKLTNQNKFRIKVKTTNLQKPNLDNLFRINSKIQKFKIFSLDEIKIIKNSDFFFQIIKYFIMNFIIFIMIIHLKNYTQSQK